MFTSRLLPLLLLLLAGTCPARGAAGWGTDWHAAVSTAQSCRRPLIVLFEHEGCPDCARMERSLAASEARKALECAVKVRLEFTHHPELTDRYGVSLTPTFLVFSPEGETLREVYREVGSMSVSRIVQVGRSVEKLAARLVPPDAEPKTVAAAAPPAEPVTPARRETLSHAARQGSAISRQSTVPTRSTARPQTAPSSSRHAPQSAPQRSAYSYYVDEHGRPVYYHYPRQNPRQPQRQQQQARGSRYWPFW